VQPAVTNAQAASAGRTNGASISVSFSGSPAKNGLWCLVARPTGSPPTQDALPCPETSKAI
jgi:hypothetical protein